MHEFSLAQALMDIVLAEAEKHGVKQISKVGVVLGVVSHVAPSSLTFCFDLVKENTAAQKAELVIRRVPLPASCADCGQSFTLKTSQLECPHCGSASVGILQDQEMTIDYIEVED